MKNKRIKEYIYALFFYSIIVFLANWSILLGTNYMKYDIWDAHYPAQIITSDALHSWSFPLWNPLYNYGSPYYAMVGTPVWYPVTLILNLFGYSPVSPAWEYCVHIVLACFGMFLLIKYELGLISNERNRQVDFCISLISGLLYGFSGIFLSNAQHIMIIISASWIPYVLLFSKKYVMMKKIKYAFATAICLSMIFLGGYPEILLDMIVVLFVWMLINYEEKSTFKRIKNVALYYTIVGLLTISASSITLFPFVNIMRKITRGSGQSVYSIPFESFFSIIFPGTEELISGRELSMESFFICIVVIIFLFYFIKNYKKIEHKKGILYFWMALVSLFLCFGQNSFLHTLMYRFIPMYSTFRFASLWRPFFFAFIILVSAPVLLYIIINSQNTLILNYLKKILYLGIILSLVIYIFKNFIHSSEDVKYVEMILNSLLSTLFILFIYLLTFRNKTSRALIVSLLISVSIECLLVAHSYFPISIARYNNTAYYSNEMVKAEINNEMDAYKNRNKECDFSNNSRSDSSLIDTKIIAINKTFDTGGYISMKLQSVEDFKNSLINSSMMDYPEAFFSNSIIISEPAEIKDLLNNPSISASDIIISMKNKDIFNNIYPEKEKSIKEISFDSFGFNSMSFSIDAPDDGIVIVLQAFYPGWKLYIDGKREELVEVDGCFIGIPLKEGNHKVELKFRPLDFFVGSMVSILFYITFFIVLFKQKTDFILVNSEKNK